MTDLPDQLRAYVDAVAEPVTMDEIRARAASPAEDHVVEHAPDRAGWRRRRPLLVALAAALVLAMVGLVAVVRSAGDDSPTPIRPAGPHGTALTMTGEAPCTADLASGGTLALGTRLSNRQRACVVQRTDDVAVTLGRSRGTAPVQLGQPIIAPLMVRVLQPPHVSILLNVTDAATGVRFTFCDGTMIDVAPFAGPTGAKFVAFEADTHYGIPGWEALGTFDPFLKRSTGPTGPFTGREPSMKGCDVARLSDLAPTWTSTPITFDEPTVHGVSTIMANDERIVVTAPASFSGSQQTTFASAAQLGAMTVTARPDRQGSFFAKVSSPGGFVLAGVADPPAPTPGNLTTTPQHAAIWWSPDGSTWTEAPAQPFVPSKQGSSPGSMIRGIAWDKGQFVAVGDFYTGTPKRKQCCGLSPALWTSRDGVHWKRRILDLGKEFDPYMTSIVRFRGAWVATGSTGRFHLVMWSSKDLVHWDKTVVERRDAGGQVAVANDALYVVGGIRGGTKQAPRTTPAIWRSTDAKHWERVLTTTSQAVPGGQSLSPVFAAGDVLVTADTTTVYESLDGRHWAPMPTPMTSAGDVSGIVFGQPTFVISTGDAFTAWSAVPHAPSGKWAAQCSILTTIRTRNETEPTLPDPTKGQAGIDATRADYRSLVAQAPDARTRQLWRTAQLLLTSIDPGFVQGGPSIAQRDAVAELDALLATHCNESTGNVFKIVVQ